MSEDNDSSVRSLVRRARDAPDEVPVEQLSAALEASDQSNQKPAITGLYTISESAPDRLTGAVPRLVAALESESATLRAKAAVTVGNVGKQNPSAVAPHVGALGELLADDSKTVRRSGVRALRDVTDGTPDAVVPVTDRLFRALKSDREVVQTGALDVLERVAAEVPGAVDADVEPLLDVLESRYEPPSDVGYDPSMPSGTATPSEQLRGVRSLVSPERERAESARDREHAVSILASLTVDDPASLRDAFEPHFPRLFDLLDDPNPTIRGTVAGILSYVAEVDPSAVRPAEDDLVDLLDESGRVSGNAIWALQYVETERAIEELRALVDDPDVAPDLRETAKSALDDLDN